MRRANSCREYEASTASPSAASGSKRLSCDICSSSNIKMIKKVILPGQAVAARVFPPPTGYAPQYQPPPWHDRAHIFIEKVLLSHLPISHHPLKTYQSLM